MASLSPHDHRRIDLHPLEYLFPHELHRELSFICSYEPIFAHPPLRLSVAANFLVTPAGIIRSHPYWQWLNRNFQAVASFEAAAPRARRCRGGFGLGRVS